MSAKSEPSKYDIYRLYVSAIPEREIGEGELRQLYPKARRVEIDEAESPKVKKEKYFVWRLLEIAIGDTVGYEIAELDIRKADTGRWETDLFDFSLSHSEGVCAVLISRRYEGEHACGADIQKIGKPHTEAFAKRIMTEGEFSEYSALRDGEREDFLMLCWCGKEAIFKSRRTSAFSARRLDTGRGVYKDILELMGGRYAVATASADGREEVPEIVHIKMH